MYNSMKIISYLTGFISCFILFCFLNISFANTSNRDLNLIKIAFQNGFESVFKLNEKEFKELKNNKEKCIQKAIETSKNYLNFITYLNR